MRLLLFIFALAYATPSVAKKQINLAIYAFDESVGKRYLAEEPDSFKSSWQEYYDKHLNKDENFRRRAAIPWPCGRKDVDYYQHTRCMVGAIVHSMERSVNDVGVPVQFQFSLAYSKFPELNIACEGSGDCLKDATYKWTQKTSADIEVLILPRSQRAAGYTRTRLRNGKMTSLVVYNSGGKSALNSFFLYRHEMGHAMGFNGHLYGNAFTFNKNRKWYPKCTEFPVTPYTKSGLNVSCDHRTFLGNWYPKGVNCPRGFFDTKWDVPVYASTFRHVFGCYVDKVGRSVNEEPPQPEPDPEPDPEKNPHKYCPNWKHLFNKYQCKYK